jgi:hypothetical protein
MKSSGLLSVVVMAISFLLLGLALGFPSTAHAAWVNSSTGQFQVGGKLAEIVPTLVPGAPGIANTPALVSPACGNQGGTSLALVRGSKLSGVDPVLYPVALVVSCLDNGGSAATRSRLNFINPVPFLANGTPVAAGTVVKQITTTIAGVAAAPSNGWAHLVHRPDKGDLLGCGSDGSVYSIDYSQTNTVADGTATRLSTPALGSCGGLAWDADKDTIYQGVSANGNQIGSVARFKEGAVSADASFTTNLACSANGLAISGGVVLVSCAALVNTTPVIQRVDKNTGANLGLYSSISLPVPGSTVSGFLGLTPVAANIPQLGDLACDPVTFQRDLSQITPINPLGRDLYRDALWSRRGANGNGVAAVEFPAFTCGLPSASVVIQGGVSFSPLAAGLSTGTAALPGQFPLTSCFDSAGVVIDTDGDGLPDCWEQNAGGSTGPGGIDFDGDGIQDVTLCAQVNIDGGLTTTLTTECADPNHKDLFAEIGWMGGQGTQLSPAGPPPFFPAAKPDPQALSQQKLVAAVGVQSVREAFGAAPVANPDNAIGIHLHIQVDNQPVTFLNSTGTTLTSSVTNVALTPCTAPAGLAPNPDDAADYDVIKNGISGVGPGSLPNFGVFDAAFRPSDKAANAMRLAWRYVLFAHNLVGNPSGGSSSSGCSEVGGDDGIVSLGSFTNGVGTTDQQAGTFMHEFGHLLGFQHGGEDNVNNKPNYRSVMSYNRQFSGSPITGRRLDYSRSEVDLDEANLNECTGIGTLASDPTLAPILPFFPTADQIAFGPGAWSVVTPSSATVSSPCVPGQLPINWNRVNSQGKTFQTATSGDINGDLGNTKLFGSNDWANVLYRFSAAIDFAGGRSETLTSRLSGTEMTKENETDFFLRTDADGNGVGDGEDCGTAVVGVTTAPVAVGNPTVPVGVDPKTLGFAFSSGTGFLGSSLDAFTYTGTNGNGFTGVSGVDGPVLGVPWPTGTTVLAPLLCPTHQCGINPDGTPQICSSTHRIDIKPSSPVPKTINLGTEANVTIAIFSEPNWDASKEIRVDALSLAQHPLTFTVGTVTEKVKTNQNGSGTCSISDVADPFTGVKDGLKDLKCQFPTSGLPTGTRFGVLAGFFFDPLTNQFTPFIARQELTILPP